MTDNEIKKALECCGRENCCGCPYRGNCHQGNPMIRDALDLINRLEAENERLTTLAEQSNKPLYEALDYRAEKIIELEERIKYAKAEAYKEFAEKLLDAYEIWTDNDELEYKYVAELVDNLLKELVGEDNV